MSVTGIEVRRRNPDVAAIGVVVGEKVELTYGDTLRVNVSFDYRGLAGSATLYGAIGNRGWAGFAEKLHNEVSIDLPESTADFTPCERSIDIGITPDIDPGIDYDLYCKIREYPEAGLPQADDVIDIVGMPPTFELIQHTIYPYAYVHDGDVETSIFTFSTAAFVPADWTAQKFAAAVESEVEKEGGRVIELKVYADKTSFLWTDFRVEVTGTPLGGAVEAAPGIGVAVGIPIWAAILIAALAIAFLIAVITWSIKTITETFTHKALSPEIKATWSKETLISTIGDFEIKLEHTPTPPEELEAMSDQELRDYCDQLAEEIVPPEISWLPLAIVGGLGILGVGAAVALAAGRK